MLNYIHKPSGILEWITCKLIEKCLARSITSATHALTTRVFMRVIRNFMQKHFTEDNEPTTVFFMVEQVAFASELSEDDGMYKKLMDKKLMEK